MWVMALQMLSFLTIGFQLIQLVKQMEALSKILLFSILWSAPTGKNFIEDRISEIYKNYVFHDYSTILNRSA